MEGPIETQTVNPVAQTLLAGALLPGKSPLRLLEKHPEILQNIFSRHLCAIWKATLKASAVPYFDKNGEPRVGSDGPYRKIFGNIHVCKVCTLPGFPSPSGLFCNMMPFIPTDPSTLPEQFRGYRPLIEQCLPVLADIDKVCYLTIHESQTHACEPQRRGGIHTDGFLALRAPHLLGWHAWGGFFTRPYVDYESHATLRRPPRKPLSGILHASSVSNSCRIWPVQIPRRHSALLSSGCDLEHLRGTLNDLTDPVYPQQNELFWMSDATPHESLPLPPGTTRQFFRIVTNDVAAWWRKHSTPNPLGIQPDCEIIEHSKFEPDAYDFTVTRPERI